MRRIRREKRRHDQKFRLNPLFRSIAAFALHATGTVCFLASWYLLRSAFLVVPPPEELFVSGLIREYAVGATDFSLPQGVAAESRRLRRESGLL